MANSASVNQERSARTKNLDHYFPFEFIERQALIHRNGSISLGFSCSAQPRSGQSEDEYANLHFALVQAISVLPVAAVIQKMEIFFEESFLVKTEGGFLARRWLNHFNSRPVIRHKSFLFLCFPNPRLQADHHAGNTWFSLGRSLLQHPHENLDTRLKEAELAASRFQSSMGMVAGLKLIRMGEAELETLCYQYMNLDFITPELSLSKSIYNDLSSCIILADLHG